MSLLPVGIDNAIVEYRAKTKEIVVNLNDAGGRFGDLEHYDAYFYAKKYPIDPNADLDVSIGYTFKDNSTGTMRFDLFPAVTDIEQGDYVYEIVLVSGNNRITVVKDRLKLIESLDNTYGNITFNVIPDRMDFTVHNISENIEVSTSPGIPWQINTPSWINANTNNVGPDTVPATINDLTESRSGIINVISSYGSHNIDVSLFQADLILNPTSKVFDPYDVSTNLSITTNDDNVWTVDSYPGWLSLDKLTGSGDDNILITSDVSQNYTTDNIIVSSLHDVDKTMSVAFDFSTILSTFPENLEFVFGANDSSVSVDLDISTDQYNTWQIEDLPDNISVDIDSSIGSVLNIKVKSIGLSENDDFFNITSIFANDVSLGITYSTVLNDNLWNFDNSLESTDGNHNWDISTGGVSWVTGKIGDAISIRGDAMVVNTDSSSYWKNMFSPSENSGWSISGWFKTSSGGSWEILQFGEGIYNTPGDFINIALLSSADNLNVDKLRMQNFNEGYLYLDFSASAVFSDWTHIVFSMGQDRILTVYLNGDKVGELTTTTTSGYINSDTIYLHRQLGTDTTMFDLLRIVGSPMNQSSVDYLYNNGTGR